MTIQVKSLIGTSQTLDGVAIGAYETQLRNGSASALTSALSVAQSQHKIQCVDWEDPVVSTAAGDLALLVGAVVSKTGLACAIKKFGSFVELTFTLTAMSMAVTDTGAGGSSASQKLFDFVQAAIVPLGCRQDYTAFVEGAALDTAAGDAAFVMAVGSVAANAGDGALTGTEADFGSATGTITDVSGTGSGTQVNGASSTAINGTGTAVDLYLNWSGSAASIDANSTIGVTGTITVLCALLGDD